MMKEKMKQLLASDPDIQCILRILAKLQLQDAWLCAGTVRNFLWNHLSGKPAFDKETDIDLIFYDKKISWEETSKIEENLKIRYPQYKWELKNQVDMHIHSPNTLPYQSARDAMSKYPETCTAIGIRYTGENDMELFLPYGIESITSFLIEPTPHFREDPQRMAVYKERLAKKDWFSKWPQLRIK
ncbi:nucleotidyltransferase family protein [Streptococcus cameli]